MKLEFKPEVEATLDAIDYEYGGDTAEYLGADWREVLGPLIDHAVCDGYLMAQNFAKNRDRSA